MALSREMNMFELKYLIPLITFLFGLGFSLFLRHDDRKKDLSTKAAMELSELANNWYEQIHDIYLACKSCDIKATELITQYKANRKILPKYLRSIEILRTNKRANNIIKLSQKALNLLTEDVIFDDCPLVICPVSHMGKETGTSEERAANYEHFLKKLDVIIQNLNREVGKFVL